MRSSRLLVAGALLGFPAGVAQAVEFSDFKQVVVLTRSGEATEEVQAATLEAVSRSIQRGLMRGVTSELMGAGQGFKKRKETQLGTVITALAAVDRFMNEETMSGVQRNAMIEKPGGLLGKNPLGGLPAALAAMGNTYGVINLEWMILPKDAKVPEAPAGSMGAVLKETALTAAAQIAELAKLSGTPEDFDNALKIYDAADATELVDGNNSDAESLYTQSYKAYRQLCQDQEKVFIPAHIRFYIVFDKGKVKVEIQTRMKPGPLSQKLFAEEEVVSPKKMEYIPHLSYGGNDPAAMMIGLSREYGVTKNEAILHVVFGRYIRDDIRSVGPCWLDCKKPLTTGNIGAQYPTISGFFQWNKIKTKKVLQRAASMLNSAVSGADDFHILLQDIAIRITDQGLNVDPKLTAVTLGVGAGKKFRQFNAWNNVKVMGMDMGVLGLDIYSQALGPEIAKNLNNEVQNSIKAANGEAADKLKLALKPITDVLQ